MSETLPSGLVGVMSAVEYRRYRRSWKQMNERRHTLIAKMGSLDANEIIELVKLQAYLEYSLKLGDTGILKVHGLPILLMFGKVTKADYERFENDWGQHNVRRNHLLAEKTLNGLDGPEALELECLEQYNEYRMIRDFDYPAQETIRRLRRQIGS